MCEDGVGVQAQTYLAEPVELRPSQQKALTTANKYGNGRGRTDWSAKYKYI